KNVAIQTAHESHELLPVTRADQPWDRQYDFYGPRCSPADRLFVAKAFPALKPGDGVAIMDAGAYFLPNETCFSHARAPAILVENGEATLLRARESFEDVVRRDRFPMVSEAGSASHAASCSIADDA